MKTPFFLIALPVVALAAPAARAEALNRYDLLGQVLEPLTAVFQPARAGQAFAATFVLEEATGVPGEWRGQEAKLVFQPPRMAKVSASVRGESWALCRVGQELWGTPGGAWEALGAFAPKGSRKSKKGGLPDFVLPFSPEQLVFLPVLFQVDDEGVSPSGARLLKVRLTPAIAEGLRGEAQKAGENPADWTARLTVREVPGGRPRLERVEVYRAGWRFAAAVRRWTLVREVPAGYWQPEAAGTPFRFTGADARRWWEAAWRRWLER